MNHYEINNNQNVGGHYHRKTREFFLITKGRFRVKWMVIPYMPGDKFQSCLVKRGDMFIFEPYVYHQLHSITKGAFITMLSIPFDKDNLDIYTDAFNGD